MRSHHGSSKDDGRNMLKTHLKAPTRLRSGRRECKDQKRKSLALDSFGVMSPVSAVSLFSLSSPSVQTDLSHRIIHIHNIDITSLILAAKPSRLIHLTLARPRTEAWHLPLWEDAQMLRNILWFLYLYCMVYNNYIII